MPEESARTGQSGRPSGRRVRAEGDAVAVSDVAGAQVVTEAMPDLRSVAVGFWVGSGAVDEAEHQLGASHFLEHLLFKGTDDAQRGRHRARGRVGRR